MNSYNSHTVTKLLASTGATLATLEVVGHWRRSWNVSRGQRAERLSKPLGELSDDLTFLHLHADQSSHIALERIGRPNSPFFQ